MKYVITGALPYVNYDLHFGHVVSCLLRPDIYSRFLRLKGEQVISICGSDEYGTPILVASELEKVTPQDLCNKYHKIQKECITKLNINFDIFSRTTSLEHSFVVQAFYTTLKNNGYIYKKNINQLFCKNCNRSLPDRYVEGNCPHCGGLTRGDQCDFCSQLLEPHELIENHCIVCKNKPVIKTSQHIFFKLSSLDKKLKNWLLEKNDWPSNARNYALNLIKTGLKDKDISRDLSWGIPIPDEENKVFYVWFDAPIGYITFAKQLGKENWWLEKDTKIIQFIGKDNIPFHTIYFPGMLLAQGKYKLPNIISACEFLNYMGRKFSKSKKVGIFLTDALTLFPADYWRYYLATILPETSDSSFDWKDFQTIVNCDLNDTIGNFINRTMVLAKKYFSCNVKKPQLSENDFELLNLISTTVDLSSTQLHSIKIKKALTTIVNLIRAGNQYINKEEPWKNDLRRQNVIYVCLQIIKAASILLQPYIPDSTKKMQKYLNLDCRSWDDAKKLENSFEFDSNFSILFDKIEDKKIETLINNFT